MLGSPETNGVYADEEVRAQVLDVEAWRNPGNDKFVDEYTGEALPREGVLQARYVEMDGFHEEVGSVEVCLNKRSSEQNGTAANRHSVGRC
eukprot:2771011-Amphidinium_carterae.2